MTKGPIGATVAPKVTSAPISDEAIDVEGPHSQAFWIARWTFFAVVLLIGLFLVLGELGQKQEHKKAGPATSSRGQSSDQ